MGVSCVIDGIKYILKCLYDANVEVSSGHSWSTKRLFVKCLANDGRRPLGWRHWRELKDCSKKSEKIHINAIFPSTQQKPTVTIMKNAIKSFNKTTDKR